MFFRIATMVALGLLGGYIGCVVYKAVVELLDKSNIISVVKNLLKSNKSDLKVEESLLLLIKERAGNKITIEALDNYNKKAVCEITSENIGPELEQGITISG